MYINIQENLVNTPSGASLILQRLYILDPLSPGIIRSICIIAISWALLLRVLIALTKLNWFGLGSGRVEWVFGCS